MPAVQMQENIEQHVNAVHLTRYAEKATKQEVLEILALNLNVKAIAAH